MGRWWKPRDQYYWSHDTHFVNTSRADCYFMELWWMPRNQYFLIPLGQIDAVESMPSKVAMRSYHKSMTNVNSHSPIHATVVTLTKKCYARPAENNIWLCAVHAKRTLLTVMVSGQYPEVSDTCSFTSCTSFGTFCYDKWELKDKLTTTNNPQSSITMSC